LAIIIAKIINSNNTERAQQDAKEKKKGALRDPIVWATIGIFLATAAAVGVGALQYLTLEKTDETLRSGQRGFAFVKSLWWRPIIRNEKLVWWGLIE
jgi:hypothetical protein